MARTINSPGVEIKERDESESTSLQAGTNILVQGFAHQGPTNELIHISSKEELNQVYFGGNGPTNDAEQYFYHSCAEILNSPANLYTIRLPYGLDSGEGFSGKYVALAYGGELRDVPVTHTVHRYVKDDDFIPGSVSVSGSKSEHTQVDLYEFSKNTIKKDDQNTSAFYSAICDYVKNNIDPDFDTVDGDPWKYEDRIPLNNDKIWIDEDIKARAIEISNKKDDTNRPTYDYSGYSVSAISFNVEYKTITMDASGISAYSSYDDIPSATWDAGAAATATVEFKNVGELTSGFIKDVLNKPITVYDRENERETETEIHPFNGFNYLYSRKDNAGSTTLIKFDYGKTLAAWKSAIETAVQGQEKTFSLQTAYHDEDLVGIYVCDSDGKRVYAGLNKFGENTLIVDTEKIADTVIEEVSKKIDDGLSTIKISFENGIPMQDASTQLKSYDGPLHIEPITNRSVYRTYTINSYNNKLVEDRISEIDVEVQEIDETTNEPIYKKVLTLNPVPVAVPLSEYQYTAIKEGAVIKHDPIYNLDGEGTGYDAFRTILGKSAFYVVNKLQTSIDDKYQGFYVAMMDYTKFVQSARGEKSKSYDPIKEITYVSPPDSEGNVTINVLPERTYNFDVYGPESLSTDIMNRAPMPFLTNKEDWSNIVVATVRCGRRASSSDPSKLSYDIKDIVAGSFDVASQIVDPITRGRVPNRIDTKMATNDYMEFVLNPSFEYDKNRPVEVRFGGKEYPNRNQESGTCCSLGLEIPCEPDNVAEYIGSVPNKIEKALSLCDNIYEFDLDILVDAGLTTIWAYVAEDSATSVAGQMTYPGDCEFNASKYIENNVGTAYELLTRSGDEYTNSIYYKAFDTIRAMYNTFCEKTRKDCMYLIDPIRATFVRGNDTKLMNIDGKIFSIDVSRALRNLFANANSSYGASYANWVKIYDNFNDEFIWMPSSPFEASIMATVDSNFYPWYAPYGLNNGILSTITDIAFRPSPKQQDDLYKMGLNMFVFFNGDGFVSWGQKTLQTKASAFDRINVRRLFLTLERSTFKTIRYFIAEPNTVFTRTRVTNALTSIMDIAKNNEGCYDYKIFCDERNNTAQVIDNNELVVDIYIKPTRIIDYIEVTFHATKTDANFDELFAG